jgi:OOP family OmpA-OmpF porin
VPPWGTASTLTTTVPALIAALLASQAVFAQESGFYLGGALGQATFKGFCVDDPIVLTCDEKDTAWKLLGGYRFNRYVAIEGTYVDFGEVSGTVNFASGPRAVPLSQTGMGIAGVGSIPFTPQFALFGKAGFLRTEQETPASASGNTKRNETELHYGLGLKFAFTPSWVARGEWERTDKTEVEMLSVGVEYRF